jgi:hypothetical protein
MKITELENLFINLYYVKGENYDNIKIELKKTIEIVRELYDTTKENDKVKAIKKLKSQYSGLVQRSKKAGEKIGWTEFVDFYNWYNNEKEECFYCNSTLEQVTQYLANEQAKPGKAHKRKKRGYSFEIDRKDHDSNYNSKDCVISCYLCNNAKSDLIEAKEFAPIGIAIGKVIRHDLK